MKAPHRNSPPDCAPLSPSTDAEVKAAASEWLMRREAGLDARAARDLDAWLAADPRHRAAFAELEQTWAVFDRAEQKGMAGDILASLERRARTRRRQRRIAMAASFAVLLLVSGVVGLRYRASLAASPSIAAVAAEPVRKLPDGSIVELNAGAEISVEYEASARRVRLRRGEAHFRVEKDPVRPFLVVAGPVEVRAVGTAFTVQLHTGGVEVVVAEGRVAVNRDGSEANRADAVDPATTSLAYMDAATRLMVDLVIAEKRSLNVEPLTEAQLAERLAWRIPRAEFAGTPLADAVAVMNRHNRLQITLDDEVAALRISGSFRPDNPEGFVRIVEATFGLQAERRSESEVRLRRASPAAEAR